MSNVAIVGAGASGLICAIFCAKKGLKVDVYEQNSKIAKKILVSGNGRCNITNTKLSSEDYFSDNYGFVQDSLKSFGFQEFEKFANSLGLLLDIKDDGRVYPLSNEAKSVVKIYEEYSRSLGVKYYLEKKVEDIKTLMKKYDNVVIATGSQAASHLGGNSDGQEFAKEFSHNIVTPYPSLVQLHLNSEIAKKMSGSKLSGEVTLLINNKKDITERGDILFTNYGVSGFAVLDISQKASAALLEYSKVDISINLMPNMNAQKISAHIVKISQLLPSTDILTTLVGLLPMKIVKNLLEDINILNTTPMKDINTKIAKKIANTITSWRFEVNDTHGFRHAEVSGGGVDTLEVNQKTMESLKEKNLYFCGEVLDVVGKRGGYNFAWAWASGYAAAKDISSKY